MTVPFESLEALTARYGSGFAARAEAHAPYDPFAGDWRLVALEARDDLERKNDYDPVLDFVKAPSKRHQPTRRSTEAMSTNPTRVAASAGDDPLKTVLPHVYFEAVAGIVVPPNGWVSCPTPDHVDRHPSCKVTNTHWRCWSCGAGGTIIDLGAAIYGIGPTGRGYWEIRDRLVADLEGIRNV